MLQGGIILLCSGIYMLHDTTSNTITGYPVTWTSSSGFARAIELQETKYCMPYPTPVFKQHYMLQELGMACNTWFLVVLARAKTSFPRHEIL